MLKRHRRTRRAEASGPPPVPSPSATSGGPPEENAGERASEGIPPNLRDKALLLPVTGILLTMPPLVTLFSRDILILGVPLLYLYLFTLWCALILCGGLLARNLDATEEPPRPGGPPQGGADAR